MRYYGHFLIKAKGGAKNYTFAWRSFTIALVQQKGYIYICGHVSSYMRMLNSSLLGNEKLRGPVARNVGRVKL